MEFNQYNTTVDSYSSGKSGNQCGRGVGMLSGYHSVWTGNR